MTNIACSGLSSPALSIDKRRLHNTVLVRLRQSFVLWLADKGNQWALT